MASPEAAAELKRQSTQNRNDIVDLYDLLKKTNETVKETKQAVDETNTKVDSLDTKVNGLDTKVDKVTEDVGQLRTQVGGLDTKVNNVTEDMSQLRVQVSQQGTRIGSLDNRVEQLDAKVDSRFDRIELLLRDRSDGRTKPPETDVMRTPQEKKLSFLETKMEFYRGDTLDNKLELKRHNQRFDRYDEQFDTLNGQMAEVLGILRDKSK